MILGFPIFVVIAVTSVVLLLRQRDPARRGTILKRAGFTVAAVFTFFFGAFVVGETFDDPGGWEALGLVAAWAVPLVALALVAWFRPNVAVWVFAILTAALIGVAILFALNQDGWHAFEDRNGPIRGVAAFTVSAGAALMGLKRTREAGVTLVVLCLVPVVIASIGGTAGVVSLAVMSSPALITGVLYLLSAASTAADETAGHPSPA